MNRGNTAWKAANLVEMQPRFVVPGSLRTWPVVVEIAKGVFLHLVSSLRPGPRDTKNPPSTWGSDSKILGFYSHICSFGTKTYIHIYIYKVHLYIYLWPTSENRRENDVCACLCVCIRLYYTRDAKKSVKNRCFYDFCLVSYFTYMFLFLLTCRR